MCSMSTVEKDKPVKEYRERRLVGEGVAVFYRMVRESHLDKMAFEQRPEGSEGRSHANSWGKDFQTEGIDSKGPESEAC